MIPVVDSTLESRRAAWGTRLPLGFRDPYPGESYDRAILGMTGVAADT